MGEMRGGNFGPKSFKRFTEAQTRMSKLICVMGVGLRSLMQGKRRRREKGGKEIREQ